MKPKKESPGGNRGASFERAGFHDGHNLPPLPAGFQCILCGSVFERRRLSAQFCPDCERTEIGR